MSAATKIEWTDSTFNPWIGCTKIGPGCDHCYAERDMDKRRHFVEWGAGKPRRRTSSANWKLPERWNAKVFLQCSGCLWRGEEGELGYRGICPSCTTWYPVRVRRRVFCASLADVFDNEVDPIWRHELIGLISRTPELDWLLLTKRIGNAGEMLGDSVEAQGLQRIPENIWLGATVVNQAEADRDIAKLLAIRASVRFLSIEPMLGDTDLSEWLFGRVTACPACPKDEDCECGWQGRHTLSGEAALHWIIAGGESGAQARPMHPDWVRGLRDQCAAAGVPFLFKQWGEWAGEHWSSVVPRRAVCCTITQAGDVAQGFHRDRNDDERMVRVGKKRAGRLLDGIEHNGFPA